MRPLGEVGDIQICGGRMGRPARAKETLLHYCTRPIVNEKRGMRKIIARIQGRPRNQNVWGVAQYFVLIGRGLWGRFSYRKLGAQKRRVECSKSWRPNGLPRKSGWASPPLVHSAARLITIGGIRGASENSKSVYY